MTEIVTEIGKRITVARGLLGMTKQELGRRVGFSWRVVHEWETGRAMPLATQVVALAEALGVSTGWLLGEPTAEVTAMAQEDGLYDEPPPANVVRLSDRKKKL